MDPLCPLHQYHQPSVFRHHRTISFPSDSLTEAVIGKAPSPECPLQTGTGQPLPELLHLPEMLLNCPLGSRQENPPTPGRTQASPLSDIQNLLLLGSAIADQPTANTRQVTSRVTWSWGTERWYKYLPVIKYSNNKSKHYIQSMGLLVNSIPSSLYQTYGVSKVAQVTNHNGKKKTGMFSQSPQATDLHSDF